MHLQFVINVILFLVVDVVFSCTKGNDWKAPALTIIIIVPFIYASIYFTLIGGWSSGASYAPKGVSYFRGIIIGNNNNGIVGLIYILTIFGTNRNVLVEFVDIICCISMLKFIGEKKESFDETFCYDFFNFIKKVIV